jgi:hypothetical protein
MLSDKGMRDPFDPNLPGSAGIPEPTTLQLSFAFLASIGSFLAMKKRFGQRPRC